TPTYLSGPHYRGERPARPTRPPLTWVGGLGEEVVRSESMPWIDPLPPLPRNERGKTAAPGRVKRDKPQVVLLIVPRSCQPADGDEGPSRSKTLSAIRAQRIPSNGNASAKAGASCSSRPGATGGEPDATWSSPLPGVCRGNRRFPQHSILRFRA